MTNPEMYPVTAKLEQKLADIEHPLKRELIDLVGEYEHGSADPDDCFNDIVQLERQDALRLYARVVEDIVLTLHTNK